MTFVAHENHLQCHKKKQRKENTGLVWVEELCNTTPSVVEITAGFKYLSTWVRKSDVLLSLSSLLPAFYITE